MLRLLVLAGLLALAKAQCTSSVTTAIGTHAPDVICSGALIFEDNFDFLDFTKWQHENTLAGGGVSNELILNEISGIVYRTKTFYLTKFQNILVLSIIPNFYAICFLYSYICCIIFNLQK